MSTVSTFGIFQSLLTNSVNSDTTLDAATKASMLARITAIPRYDLLGFTAGNVVSTTGLATVNAALNEIAVATGVTGNNRVVWGGVTFVVPVDISGSLGERGFLPGHGGDGTDGLVALADISLQYRLSATGVWAAFNRSTSLKGVTYIEFAADIADQGSDAVLPQVNIPAYQV